MKFVAAALAFILVPPASAATLGEAQSLYDRNQIAQAEKAFAKVAADASATKEDRSSAQRQLARIAWLIDGKPDLALQHLDAAARLGSKLCETSELVARILNEAERDEEALRRGPALLSSCREEQGLDDIRIQLVRARLDLAERGARGRVRLLQEAVLEGERIADRTNVAGASARLEAALLTGDADRAFLAWRDYFWLDEADAPQALASYGAAGRFRTGLATGASAQERLQLAELLMRAGFAQHSERFASAYGLPGAAADDPLWRKLRVYWDERRKLAAEVLRVNRALARGANPESLSLEPAARAAMGQLMAAAGEAGEPRDVLRKHYGIVGSVGKTSGYPSVHMGHLIEDRADRVTQYGRSADIHLMIIDNMVANGFESWLWDGSATVGGWTDDDVIVHVRPGYVQSPIMAYQLTHDSPERRELIGRQAKRAAEDIAKLKARQVATLSGLSDRLQLQLVDQIWSSARSRGTNEADVKRLFLGDYFQANLDQSIRVHEGRHAIDETLGLPDKVDQSVLEYNAKLAELALAAYPRLALRNMNRNLEGSGPHDRGGARVFDEFRKWIEAHSDQVAGYDPKLPALVQLDKLTDGQIREIARGLDPLARTDAATASSGTPS